MHHLVLGPGRAPFLRFRRRVLEAHQHLDLDAERLLVEVERLLGAAVEEQIDLGLHGWSLPRMFETLTCDYGYFFCCAISAPSALWFSTAGLSPKSSSPK